MFNILKCLVLASSAVAFVSHAGSAPVTIGSADGLGLSDGFNIRTQTITTTTTTSTGSQAINDSQGSTDSQTTTISPGLIAFTSVLQATSASNQVANPLGDCVAVSPEKLAVLSDAIALDGEAALNAKKLLEEQISSELEGEPVSIEILDFTAGSLVAAADSANEFVEDLDSELLETALYSPTLMVILNSYGARMDLVQGGKQSCAAETNTAATEDTLFSQDITDPSNLGLIRIKLAP